MTNPTVTAAADAAPTAGINGRNATDPTYRAIRALQEDGKANAVAELFQAQYNELSDVFRKLSGADALLERGNNGDDDMAEANVKEVLQALEDIMGRLNSVAVLHALVADARDLQGVSGLVGVSAPRSPAERMPS
jgi:hypothetical protein